MTVTQSVKRKKLSPGRIQYLRMKADHPDSILLFRIGDFYETFDDDARVMAKTLDIALTSREVGGSERVPLAGIPYHALENYLSQLVKAGLKVAIAEQTSEPSAGQPIVRREVVRIVTPGTIIEPDMLDEGVGNFLAAALADGETAGLAFVDLTTSEFLTTELPLPHLRDELIRVNPAEVLANTAAMELITKEENGNFGILRNLEENQFDFARARELLKEHFSTTTLEAFGCEDKPYATLAAARVLEYLSKTQMGALPQIVSLATYRNDRYMQLNSKALQDLEVIRSNNNERGISLLSVMGNPKTPMGKRLLRKWLVRPLVDQGEILKRQDIVALLYQSPMLLSELQDKLGRIPDLERLINKVKTLTATPRDLTALSEGLEQLPFIVKVLNELAPPPAKFDTGKVVEVREPPALINAAVRDDPSQFVGKGETIRQGFDSELDKLTVMSKSSRSKMLDIEREAKAKTGIKNLKVGYSRVFGYYIEVSKSQVDKVSPDFDRRQTVANGERYTTSALKELESSILRASEQIQNVERAVFHRICGEIALHGERILSVARAIGRLDVFVLFALTALEKGWNRPEMVSAPVFNVKAARHPLAEEILGPGKFVPNDIAMSKSENRLMIITGPNMSGKSTFIKMAATLSIMAQVGSFIPADKPTIGIADRIFTRAGLSDDVSGGMSTFMVEMLETAVILNQATPRSLVIFDEIGRGTSTYDGLAIAQAVAEYIHSAPRLGCRTLFATHFQEMTQLGDALPKAANFQVAVTEKEGNVFFLHRILPGGTDRSYGVHVAKLAGIPRPVVKRAAAILSTLENDRNASGSPHSVQTHPSETIQMRMFPPEHSNVRDRIMELDIDGITPLEALNALAELRQMAEEA